VEWWEREQAKLARRKQDTQSTQGSRSRRVHSFPVADTKTRAKLFAFCYGDIAAWCGITEESIRRAVSKGRLDPMDFDSLMNYRQGLRKVTIKP